MNKHSNVYDLLRSRFPANQYALLHEVRDAAGFQANRSADAIAMNLWPSRGLELHGFEIKSGRGDWLKEFKSPEKAESIFQYCDRFWLVATNEKVVLSETEIPKTWGYLLCKNDRVYTKKEAPQLKAKPLSRDFIAAMLKRATTGLIHPSTVEDKIQAALEKGRSEKESYYKDLQDNFQKMEKAINDFHEASGVNIYQRWADNHAEKVGGIVKLILNKGSDVSDATEQLARIKNIATGIVQQIDETLASVGASDSKLKKSSTAKF